MNPNITAIIGQITSILTQIIAIALLVLIAATVLAKLGFSQRIIPAMATTELAWLCGGWWLYRGGKL
jgi:hypothetical protein